MGATVSTRRGSGASARAMSVSMGAAGLKVSLRACTAVTLVSPMRSAVLATKRIFLALPSMRVKRRCGFTTASGSPGNPAPVPTSATSSPLRSPWMLRLSSR